MRDDIFNSIITLLKTSTKLQGENGTIRVYDFPQLNPDGYPYAVVGSESLESIVLDNARDSRRYNYVIQIVGEKFGDQAGLTQSEALATMRKIEDSVLAIFDLKNGLGNSSVVRTFPTRDTFALSEDRTHVILTINLVVDTMVQISY